MIFLLLFDIFIYPFFYNWILSKENIAVLILFDFSFIGQKNTVHR